MSPRDTTGWYRRGYIPHFDGEGPVFITYRLADSLPQSVADELKRLLPEERPKHLDANLDDCAGSCVLERPECAAIVEENLKYFDGTRYRLCDWVVMPNHVHVIIDHVMAALDEILHSWRSYTSNKIQERLAPGQKPKTGRLWQRGYFDRDIRDGNHMWSTRCYILLNPVHAGLVDEPREWKFSSAKGYDHEELDVILNRWLLDHQGSFFDTPY
jgi:REP element-mobilizing transposase RayT